MFSRMMRRTSAVSSTAGEMEHSRPTSAAASTSGSGFQAVPEEHMPKEVSSIKMEESFTVYLGAQHKTEHNIRLMSANPIKMCKCAHKGEESEENAATRLSKSMALYSSGSLQGLVVLVDGRIGDPAGSGAAFSRVCELTTEAHFQSLEEQLAMVVEDLQKVA